MEKPFIVIGKTFVPIDNIAHVAVEETLIKIYLRHNLGTRKYIVVKGEDLKKLKDWLLNHSHDLEPLHTGFISNK